MRHEIVWVANSRPDVMAASSIFSQTTEKTFAVEDIKKMNKVLKHREETSELSLKYRPLDSQRKRIVVFADGSHASN